MQRLPPLGELSEELEGVSTPPVQAMKKSHRDVLREKAEQRQKRRRESAARAQAKATETGAKVQQSLERPSGVAQQTLRGVHDDSLSFFRAVHEKAPRLVVPENKQALIRLASAGSARNVAD